MHEAHKFIARKMKIKTFQLFRGEKGNDTEPLTENWMEMFSPPIPSPFHPHSELTLSDIYEPTENKLENRVQNFFFFSQFAWKSGKTLFKKLFFFSNYFLMNIEMKIFPKWIMNKKLTYYIAFIFLLFCVLKWCFILLFCLVLVEKCECHNPKNDWCLKNSVFCFLFIVWIVWCGEGGGGRFGMVSFDHLSLEGSISIS